ncbi:MAG TPA: hypothetical protein VFW88_06935 [Burkholderiales bacterium]|nr:hypothetical protein [Burkholderiales bacterium]
MRSLTSGDMAEFWRRMAAIFGHRWTSAYGETDEDDTWLRGLSDLTPQDLADGLHGCVNLQPDDAGKVWPPNLPEFRALVRTAKRARIAKLTPPTKPQAPMTPEQRAEARRQLRELQKLFGMAAKKAKP